MVIGPPLPALHSSFKTLLIRSTSLFSNMIFIHLVKWLSSLPIKLLLLKIRIYSKNTPFLKKNYLTERDKFLSYMFVLVLCLLKLTSFKYFAYSFVGQQAAKTSKIKLLIWWEMFFWPLDFSLTLDLSIRSTGICYSSCGRKRWTIARFHIVK